MRRTELLQEIRKMRFEEAYQTWTEGKLSQEKAAAILGVSSRTFRRYINRYEEGGVEGLLDRRLTQASFRRAPVDEVMAVTDLYASRHRGWNVKHFYTWYQREGGIHGLRIPFSLRVRFPSLPRGEVTARGGNDLHCRA